MFTTPYSPAGLTDFVLLIRKVRQTNFFNLAGSNTTLATTNEIISKDGDYSSVVASAVQGAEFVDEVLNNSFFEKVTYKGAFDGKNDWTAGWTNWDPQNTEY